MQKGTHRLRIVFAGTPQFAATILTALLATSHEVLSVWTQPDRGSGRGRKLTSAPVKKLAESHALPVYQPESMAEPKWASTLIRLAPDVMIVAAYGLILPSSILEIPRLGCVNVHASLLPRWRGAAPVQHAILAGDTQTGVSIMLMDEGLDTGDILGRARLDIAADDTAETLERRIAELGGRTLVNLLDPFAEGTYTRVAQDAATATYAPRIRKSDGQIDWTRSAVYLARMVRAYNPWPVAFTSLNHERLRVWESVSLEKPCEDEPGRIVGANPSGIDVATGEGQLSLRVVQLPGARQVSVRDFLNAHPLLLGQRLGE